MTLRLPKWHHPLLAAACELWYQIHRNRPKAIEVLEAWGRYAKLPYMTGEGFSPFIYGSWINLSILSAAVRQINRRLS